MTPTPLHDVESDFTAAHGRADGGSAIANLDALLDPKPAAPSAPSAAPPSAGGGGAASGGLPAPSPTPSKPLSPLGQSLGVTPEERDTPLGLVALHRFMSGASSYAGQYVNDLGQAWSTLKSDLQAAVPDEEKFKNADFWTATRMQVDSYLAAGKSIGDALGLALAPLIAAADVATSAEGDLAHAAAPVVPAKLVKEALDHAMVGIASESGLKAMGGAAASKAAAAAGGEAGPPGAAAGEAAAGATPAADTKTGGTNATAIERAQQSNVFTGQAAGAGSRVGMTQPKGTPVEKLFANFADAANASDESQAVFREKMFGRADQDPRNFANDDVLTSVESFPGNLTAQVDAARSGNTRVRVMDGDNVVAAARIQNGMIDAIAVKQEAKGRAIGESLLGFLGQKDIANIHEVPDRSPGFVDIQKRVLAAKPTAAGEAAAAEAPAGAAEPKRDWMYAGQPPDKAGRLRVTDADKAKAADYLSGKIPENPVQASLATLQDENGARETITKIAKFIPEGAVKHDDVLEMGAYSLQRSPEEIVAGLQSVLPTDEEILAWKMTMDAAGAEVKRAADAYTADPSPANLEAFTRNFTLGLKVTRDWDEVGTAQARAFRARQLAVEDSSAFSKSIKDILANVGPDNMAEAAQKLNALKDPAKVPPFLQWLRRMKSRDGLVYGWSNILLSNVPKTLSKKLFGDAFSAAFETATTGLSEAAGASPAGSTKGMLYGYMGGFKDAMRMAGKALKEGESQFYADYQSVDGMSKTRLDQLSAGIGDTASPTNAAIAYLRSALPTAWIGAADDFAKVWHYRAKANELVAAAAKGDPEKIAAAMNNIPKAVHEQSVAYALKASFQEPLTGLAETMRDAIDKTNIPISGLGTSFPLGRAVMPFVKVPVNLDRFAYRASPLPLAFPSDAYRGELMAGGARAAKARAAVGLGTGFAMIGATLAVSDRLTGMGPSEADERRFWLKTHQPYSMRLGDTWYGYQGAHPLGLMLAPIADTVDTFRFLKDRDAEDAALSVAFGIGHALLSPTFMTGASDFLEALNDPSADGRRYFDNLAASIGAPQGEAAIDNAIDPWRRAHYGALEAVRARTPGLSKSLPPAVDIWGDPIPRTAGWLPFGGSGGAVARAISPVPMEGVGARAQPIDRWIWDHHTDFARDEDQGRIISPPGQAFSWEGGNGVSAHVQLNGQQLYRLRVLAGNELKDPQTKLGAKDALNALVEGNYPGGTQKEWNAASDGRKALMVQRLWGKYRNAAKQALFAEDAGLRDAITQQLQDRGAALSAGANDGSGGGQRPAGPSAAIVAQPRF